MPFFTTPLKPGAIAPPIRLLDHRGRNVGLDDFRDKQGMVLLFFSSDRNADDLKMLKDFICAYPHFQEAGIQVLALSSVNWENLHYLAQQLNPPFPILFDVACRYSKQYGAMLIPKFVTGRAVFAVGQNGRILMTAKNASPEAVLEAFQ